MAEVVLALDLASGPDALLLVDRLPGLRWAKVGPMLFLRDGPALVRELTSRGVKVFLDLKWHDIPSSVAGAVRAAGEHGVALATVHALGGRAMLEAAAAAPGGAMRLVAVSVLTSHTAEDYWGALGRRDRSDVADEVVRLARMAVDAGIDGVVASPLEVAAVRQALGPDRWIVVPGIRPASVRARRASPVHARHASSVPANDQSRTATPEEAVAAGATHLVVGRPITRAKNPREVYEQICAAASSS